MRRRLAAPCTLGAMLAAAMICGHGTAAADTDTESLAGKSAARGAAAHPVSRERPAPRNPKPANDSRATAAPSRLASASAPRTVAVSLPPMPVQTGRSFTVSTESITEAAADYLAAGGDPADSPRFFFGDLAVGSLDGLAAPDVTPEQVRTQVGNLAVSGYFGGVWLRDNLRGTPAVPAAGQASAAADLSLPALAIGLFDVLAAGLTGTAASGNRWAVTTAAHLSVPVLLALYGYNRGYLEYLLDNPPAGVPSMRDTLSCNGFLDCSSSAFPLGIADRYDTALVSLEDPATPGWREMKAWSAVLEGATGTGRAVWQLIAGADGFSADSYQSLVGLSSAYLMVSKAAVLSAMLAAADGDAGVGAGSLRLQAGLWMWSGAYFGGLASPAPPGTLPAITVA